MTRPATGTRALWAATLATSTLVARLASAQDPIPEPPPPVEPWYDALELGAFADAYASVNTNLPKPNEGANAFRAYDTTTGFALAWVGLDVGYEPAPIGGKLSLRFGPAAERYSDSCLPSAERCDGDVPGLGLVKQAYASWRPIPALRFDLGKFDTLYGAEVAESQDNLNYSRGVLYWFAQPAYHTGLRASARLLPELEAKVLVVNGQNRSIDNNAGKTFGLQLVAQPWSNLAISAGWLGGPEQDDHVTVVCEPGTRFYERYGVCWPNSSPDADGGPELVDRGGANLPEAWRHLLDLVVAWEATPRLALVLNADYGLEGVREEAPSAAPKATATFDGTAITLHEIEIDTRRFYGVMVGGRYVFTDVWAAAARAEYFADPDGHATGYVDLELVTGTLTLELMPSQNLQLRLEGRGDFDVGGKDAQRTVFPVEVRDHSDSQFTTTFSAVIRTL